jgi:hypothetical protein
VSDDLRPSAGARFLLERTTADRVGPAASYRGTIYTPASEHAYALELSDRGEATLAPAGDGGAEAALEERLLDLARSTARAAARRRIEGLEPWPERILRWRGPGRG